MKQRLVHFRTKPRQEDKPSVIRRVAQVAVPLAAVGGVYAYMHLNSRPRRAPIPDNNPGGKYDASRKLAAHGGTPIVSAKVNAVLASATKNIGGSMTADDLAGTVPFAPKASTPAPVTPAAPAPAAPTPAAPTSRPATNPPGHRAIIVDKPQAPKTPGKKPKVLDRRDPKVKAMLKKHNGWTKDPKTLAAHIRQVAFNRQDWTNGNSMGTPDGVMTAVRKGQRIVPWVNRSGEVAGDLGDMASGKQVKDPFFKKTWFKRAMQGAAIAAPILASRKLSKYHRQAEEAKSGLGSPLSGYRLKALTLAKEWLPDTVYKHAVERPMFDTKVKNLILLEAIARHSFENNLPTATKRDTILQRPSKNSGGSSGFPGKPGVETNTRSHDLGSRILLHAVEEHLTQFDYTADQRGWDLRDARGRSARVYAPGSRRRERREKEWGEKTDNIRMVRNAAILAAAAGLGGTVYYRSQAKKLTPVPKNPAIPDNIVQGDFKKALAARVRLTRFSRSDRRPTLDRVLAAANEHALDPAVDALVPTVPDSVKSGASRVADDMTRGVLENAGYGAFRTLKRGAIAGTLLGGGALLGHLKRKPRLGLAGGSLAAGMYLGKSS